MNQLETATGPAIAELLEAFSPEEHEVMLRAGYEVRECFRVLDKVGLNVVGEILEGQGPFYELQHYPKGDVYDMETHAQYYYHAHRPESGEHGHFHTFLRAKGMPRDIRPAPYEGEAPRPLGKDAVSHIIAISMNAQGYPTHLFTTNRWVTAETWYRADDVIRMIDHFIIDHAWPSWATNRWITAMLTLFKPQIAHLLRERDRTVAAWQASHPDRDVFEDRELDVTSIMPISVEAQIAALEARSGIGDG